MLGQGRGGSKVEGPRGLDRMGPFLRTESKFWKGGFAIPVGDEP